MKPTGLDQSWGFADPKAAAKAGVQVVSMYLSWDATKNVTARDVKAYHKVGIGVMLNWESQQGAPLAGAKQARADATEAVRQAKQLFKDVGYPPEGTVVVYFSCDRDVNAGQFGTVFDYYKQARTICHSNGLGVGAYGEASLVSALARAKITDAEWQSAAWSNGVLSPDADFFQYLNGQKLGGAQVDFDRIIHRGQLGAWWPPGNTKGQLTMDQYAALSQQIADLAKRVDAVPDGVWSQQIRDPLNPAEDHEAARYLTYANAHAQQARDLIRTLAKSVVVDTAAVALDIRDRLVSLLGGHS